MACYEAHLAQSTWPYCGQVDEPLTPWLDYSLQPCIGLGHGRPHRDAARAAQGGGQAGPRWYPASASRADPGPPHGASAAAQRQSLASGDEVHLCATSRCAARTASWAAPQAMGWRLLGRGQKACSRIPGPPAVPSLSWTEPCTKGRQFYECPHVLNVGLEEDGSGVLGGSGGFPQVPTSAAADRFFPHWNMRFCLGVDWFARWSRGLCPRAAC